MCGHRRTSHGYVHSSFIKNQIVNWVGSWYSAHRNVSPGFSVLTPRGHRPDSGLLRLMWTKNEGDSRKVTGIMGIIASRSRLRLYTLMISFGLFTVIDIFVTISMIDIEFERLTHAETNQNLYWTRLADQLNYT